MLPRLLTLTLTITLLTLLPAQTELFPSITPEQWTAIESKKSDYLSWFSENGDRIGQVWAELYDEERRPVLDPLAFGLRIAELTAIRRQGIARIAEAVIANRKPLSPSQLAQLDALVINQKAMALTYFAPCEYWFTSPPTAERPIDHYNLSDLSYRYPSCTTPTLADYLELSLATRADFSARRDRLFRSFDQLLLDYQKHRAAYQTALEASPLDPPELGRAAVAIRQVFRDYGDRRTEFINRRYADLTPAQQAKLRIVSDANLDALRAETASCYGLLAKPALVIPNDQPDQNGYYGDGRGNGFRHGCLDPLPFWAN